MHTSNDINELEAATITKAWEAFGDRFEVHQAITLLTDNAATMYTLRKGRAHEHGLNASIDRALRAIAGNPNVRVAYIATDVNPADALSRGLPLDKQLASTLWAVGRRSEAAALRVAAPACFPTRKGRRRL